MFRSAALIGTLVCPNNLTCGEHLKLRLALAFAWNSTSVVPLYWVVYLGAMQRMAVYLLDDKIKLTTLPLVQTFDPFHEVRLSFLRCSSNAVRFLRS